MNAIASILRGGLAAATLALAAFGAHAQEKVTVQLKWVPQAQFAGYYMAAAKGYYKAEGLDVTIKPGGPDISPVQVIAGRQADVVVNWMPDALAAREAGVPLVPGTDSIATAAAARAAAEELGYPVVMKASAGGGGKGMFRADGPGDLDASFATATREAEAAFGDGRLYMERLITEARHVEVQVVGDGEGTVVHFGDRDCSVQRRYQKLVEEGPVTAMPPDLQARLREAAVRLCAHARYRSAGTVEFLYDVARQDFYFIEVNSRIQVEHPVSEEVTGHDLIARQLSVAAGTGIGVTQDQVATRGHAIEVRVNAEDPRGGFAPSPGRVTVWRPPAGEGIRIDSHMREGDLVPPFYDSMVGKLIVHGRDRDAAIEGMLRAIHDFRIEGIRTTLPLAAHVVGHPDFRDNRITTRWLEDKALPRFLSE